MLQENSFLTPPVRTNPNGEIRKVGFELEFSGLYIEEITKILSELLNAKVEHVNKYKNLLHTEYGKFEVILDFQLLTKGQIHTWFLENGFDDEDFKEFLHDVEEFIGNISSIVVPYEVSTPPLPLDKLYIIEEIKNLLQKHGALGSEASIFYAFGFHINPEVFSFEVEDILDILRAFFVLEDFLDEYLKPDLTRKLLPYINPFDDEYKKLVVDENYSPSLSEFIDDYLRFNPTRNRSLDLLPLLCYLDEKRVREILPKEKIGKRPTFHYRLPTSRVDDPSWHTYEAWNSWVFVEKLSLNKDELFPLLKEYKELLDSVFSIFEKEEFNKKVQECLQRL